MSADSSATSLPAHRNADIGRGERRRVVDAVADHGHRAVEAAEVGDRGHLVGRQQAGANVGHAGRGGDRARRRRGIAGEHRDVLHALIAQQLDDVGGDVASAIGDAESGHRQAVDDDVHGATAFHRKPRLFGSGGARQHAALPEQAAVADEHAGIAPSTFGAEPG